MLQHLDEFNMTLKNYKPSKDSLHILTQLDLIVLTAPTAGGRNTIIKQLLKTGNYYFIISDTTREPQHRDGKMEQNGHEYFFRSEDEILEDLNSGAYLEAAVIHETQVSGISIRELAEATKQQKTAITDINIDGVESALKLMPAAKAIFVLPPSFEEWQRRLQARGHMSPEHLRNRMKSAVTEFSVAIDHDYYTLVVNDTIQNAAIQINHIVRMGQVDTAEQAALRQLAEQLLIETKSFLEMQL